MSTPLAVREIRRETFALPFNGPSPSTTRPLGSTAAYTNVQTLLASLG
jgi:hypothetical protein